MNSLFIVDLSTVEHNKLSFSHLEEKIDFQFLYSASSIAGILKISQKLISSEIKLY